MAAAAAGPATAQRFFRSFSDLLIDENPQAALEKLTKILEQKPDYYCYRTYCHVLLGNYCDAVADAKKSLELNPNNSPAMLRKGICEYHEKHYAAVLGTFLGGQELDSVDPAFTVWTKTCQETGSQTEVSASQRTHQSKIKYDLYQTESQVIIKLVIKNNVQKNNGNVEFSEKELSALVKLPSGEDYNFKLRLLHPIIPEQSTFRTEAVRREKVKGQGDVPKPKQFTADIRNLYPSSSHYARNWDKLLEGDAALNKLFQQIYSDGSDDMKRAMIKSFTESGGTVLNTNWSDVGKRKVEIHPPDDME
uniref:SGT1 homolog, MIS12 kinetochore complex assembly cochaperone n=1 Tax=Ursus americanus TaxID=9643 RepID=A0A452QLY3_URSAM